MTISEQIEKHYMDAVRITMFKYRLEIDDAKEFVNEAVVRLLKYDSFDETKGKFLPYFMRVVASRFSTDYKDRSGVSVDNYEDMYDLDSMTYTSLSHEDSISFSEDSMVLDEIIHKVDQIRTSIRKEVIDQSFLQYVTHDVLSLGDFLRITREAFRQKEHRIHQLMGISSMTYYNYLSRVREVIQKSYKMEEVLG